MNKRIKKNSAFVMLFSVVVSSILLAIALGVANIAIKELSFDTSAKRTNDAFFAADTAVECALYHDLASGDTSAFGVPSTDLSTTCAGTDVDLNNDTSVPTTGPWDFTLFPLAPSGNACAKVTVTKTIAPDPESTVITARGYNLGGNTNDCSSSSQNRVERELQVTIGEPPGPPVFYDLNVAVSGPANSGSVTSDVGSINCPGACTSSYLAYTVVTLTANAQSGFSFTGWNYPGCTGTGSCVVTMNSAKSITATFDVFTAPLEIAGTASSVGTSTGLPGGANTNTHVVAIPPPVSGNGAGDLLVALFSVDGDTTTLTWPADWPLSQRIFYVSQANGTHAFEVRYKIATGGDTLIVNTSINERSAHRTFRITGFDQAYAPEVATDIGFDQYPDSPLLNPVSWGTSETLWISTAGRHNGDSNTTAWPTGYTTYPGVVTGGFTLGVALDTATLVSTATSEDPGPFTVSSSNNDWIAATIAIKGN